MARRHGCVQIVSGIIAHLVDEEEREHVRHEVHELVRKVARLLARDELVERRVALGAAPGAGVELHFEVNEVLTLS